MASNAASPPTDQQLPSVSPRVKEEVEALLAIFPETATFDAEQGSLSIRSLLPEAAADDGEAATFDVTVVLTDDYPDVAPPLFWVNAAWLSDAEAAVLVEAVAALFVPGQEVLFDLVEALRARVHPPRSGSSSPPPQPSLSEAVRAELTTVAARIRRGGIIVDRRSIFQAHVAAVHSHREVLLFREFLLMNQKIARAAHNILAYRIYVPQDGAVRSGESRSSPGGRAAAAGGKSKPRGGPSRILLQDHDSDGEDHAGGRLQHLLHTLEVEDVAVLVTRWYGGIHLGPDRFKHINNAARAALEDNGFISDAHRRHALPTTALPPASKKFGQH